MTTNEEINKKIADIEKELRETPHHKGTNHYIGLLRAKLAKLKDEIYYGHAGGGGGGFALKKHGDATVALIGPPSVGKSSLINCLADISSPVGAYDFTTKTVVPGMMALHGAQIQLFDLPGLIEGAVFGKGKGKQVIAAARAADLIIIISDAQRQDLIGKIEDQLKIAGFRLNAGRPKIDVQKALSGGILVKDPFGQFSAETVKQILQEYGIKNGSVWFKERLSDFDLLLDALSANRFYVPAIKVINKSDMLSEKQLKNSKDTETLYVSAKTGSGLEKLKETIWEKLELIRVFLKKEPNKNITDDEPMIIKKGKSITQLVDKVNSSWLPSVREALVWGRKAKFQGQKVSLSYQPEDGDQIYLVR